MPRLRFLLPFFLAASVLCASPGAQAFLTNIRPVIEVVEYQNLGINHYFLTSDRGERASIESGAAGPNWVRTGFGFKAYAYVTPLNAGAKWVDRFHGTPGVGPNSHFFTADSAESEGLRRPGTGWDYEGRAFAIDVPTNGRCAGGFTPVYRLYNNRGMFNDASHRYVTNATERAAMVAAGWIDEGARFCSEGAIEVPLAAFAIDTPLPGNILPSATCEDETVHLGPCVAVNNLPVPSVLRMLTADEMYGLLPYVTHSSGFLFTTQPANPFGAVVRDSFVQGGAGYFGIHVDTRHRGAAVYSSVNPLYQFRTDPPARFFPWSGTIPFETQLSIVHTVSLARVNLFSPGSHAYGHPTVEFIDQRSGLHVYFTVLSYGTQAPTEENYLARDVVTGKVIVGTAHRPGASIYGRSLGSSTLHVASGYEGYRLLVPLGGTFDYRVDRTEFQHVLAAARSVEPSLSADPVDYFVDNFHFNNEVYRDGEIGVDLTEIALRVMRR